MELPKVTSRQILVGSSVASFVGGAVVGSAITGHRKKARRRKTSHKAVRKRISRSNKRRGRRYSPHTAGKRKDTSRRRIRYTSRGQPYVIGAHGKARFISRKSAKSSYSKKGGKY